MDETFLGCSLQCRSFSFCVCYFLTNNEGNPSTSFVITLCNYVHYYLAVPFCGSLSVTSGTLSVTSGTLSVTSGSLSATSRTLSVISGSLSPRHGASSGCGWRNGLQICRVAANILNKQSRIADKGWSSSLGVVLTTPHSKNLITF